MGVYIGYIEKRDSNYNYTFYNYKPIAELEGRQISLLSSNEQSELLPKSNNLNINFSYNMSSDDDQQWMENNFPENSLVVFEFTLDDLEDNFKTSGERNQTGYKVQVKQFWAQKKIRSIDKDNIYYVIQKKDLHSDFINDPVVDIEAPFLAKNSQVYVQYNNFLAGPYDVGYRTRLSSYYITPHIKEKKYTLSGYTREDINFFTLDNSNGSWDEPPAIVWPLIIPKANAIQRQKDVIDTETLFESFRESILESEINDGAVQLNDIPKLLERYDQSTLSGSILTDEICQNRLDLLRSRLTADKDVDLTLNEITNFVCDLLIRRKDDPEVNEWLKELINVHPELIDQLKDVQAISEQIDLKEQSLTDLNAELEQKQEKLKETTQEENTILQEAIEKKENELREMDEEYKKSKQRIEEIKGVLQLSDDLTELKAKQGELQDEVAYLETHKSHLEKDTSELELEFQQLINRQHDSMVNIAFDGFMSSKMLNAATTWEADESAKRHEALVCAVNNINAPDMTPDELVNYLCRTIQLIRPTYTKNTIVNIMICISQSFLTVFSGEPGCGKTSICNIVGETLGLNKISEEVELPEDLKDEVNRYIPISVERGWTSKRDFIGYYNPLSKVFDKSNSRVYEALHQLDTEKQKGFSKFPYIILLDESNLSPMEYYWSDFMNICDDLGPQSKVNLGENYLFGIPETLHFVATINNDHTTETLSPRLIDRAWIISLPKQEGEILPL